MARAAEWQSAMAAATAFAFPNSTGIFSTLGGSNTLGACDTAGKLRCNQTAFSRLTFDSLQSLHAVNNWVNGGIGAMGPELAAACTQKFAPEGTRMATIEYLPNLGYTNDDVRELAAIERLLHYLQRRGARVAFVNILPGKAMPRMVHCRDRLLVLRRFLPQYSLAGLWKGNYPNHGDELVRLFSKLDPSGNNSINLEQFTKLIEWAAAAGVMSKNPIFHKFS